MNSTPLLSIIVLTYNHEKYIRQALESILMQRVNFEYEIIVGEDCSPDDTRNILKKYEEKFPDKFNMIYHDKNVGGRNNLLDLFQRSRGKYIAQLEGDDYWTDIHKLQRQVDFMEKNNDYIATAHKTVIVNENGNRISNKMYPECYDLEYTLDHYKRNILPGQSATIVMRNFLKESIFNLDIYNEIPLNLPSDRITMFLLVSYGRIHCFDEKMSAYRYVTDSGTSFSARSKNKSKSNNFNATKDVYEILINDTKKNNDNIDSLKTLESMYCWSILSEMIKSDNKLNIRHLLKITSSIQYKNEATIYIIYRILDYPLRIINRKKGMIGR